MGLLKIGLELFGLGLCLGGLRPGFLLGALEVRYLSPRFFLIGAELVQLAVHVFQVCTTQVTSLCKNDSIVVLTH